MGKELTVARWPSFLTRQTLLQGGLFTLCSVLLLCLFLPSSDSTTEQVTVSQQGLLSATESARSRFNLGTRQEDVFISVKTSGQFHKTRLDLVLNTWFPLAREQTWFFTDTKDDTFNDRASGHLRVTGCNATHSRQDLCCKMAAEFDAFLESGKRWWCHFDDDNYVNVPALTRKLTEFDHRQDWYLGKPSLPNPLEVLDRDDEEKKANIKFWFGTGGAGFCISHSLAMKMLPVAGGGKFESVGDHIRMPDDVTMGYISEHMLNTPLTVVEEFHSHLEPQRFLSEKPMDEQISFSYSKYGDGMNVVSVPGFDELEDPTRFKSIHCKLFPNFSWCPGWRERNNNPQLLS